MEEYCLLGCDTILVVWYVFTSVFYAMSQPQENYSSAEIPTRCSFVIEFIIPKFFEGSACFERHTAHHQVVANVESWQRPVTTWVYKPEAANTV
jgi:hypothetical protein